MKENNSTNAKDRLPVYPPGRLPVYPPGRLPVYPPGRISGISSQFFESFTKFKNTETKWDSIGFTKKVK